MSNLIRRDVTECSTSVRVALRALRQALEEEFPGSPGVQVTLDDLGGYHTRITVDAIKPPPVQLHIV